MDAYRVQKHVSDWLNAAGIQGLDRAWPAMPDALGFPWSDYGGTGAFHCQAVASVTGDTDIRRSTPLHYGIRWQTWDVMVEVCLNSTDPDWDSADQRLKAIVQSMKEIIKKDPALGTLTIPDPLYLMAAEGKRGISTRYLNPYVDTESGAREQWATITFQCATERTG